MTTRSLMLAVLMLGCSGRVVETTGPAGEAPIARTPPAADIPIPASKYAGHGFVVHEWGTLTSVVGSDGSTQPGLHHEEEDLPGFVADRMKQAELRGGTFEVDAKMETPVTYFYSDTARTVSARVSFPTGIFTQWYPFVATMSPPVLKLADGLHDRRLQSTDSIPASCRPLFAGAFNNGLLDWSNLEILAPTQQTELPGPLGKTTWGFARNVAANALRVQGQSEKFLFYRGLGSYDYPVRVVVEGGGVRLTNGIAAPIHGVFLMNVTRDGAGFTEVGDLASAATTTIPSANLPHGRFVATLKAKLATRLVEDGLFTDEALAMVDTWERSYFLTPGVRVLYLLPQEKTDALIPLTIAPAPDALKRTMVIRVEVMTPEQERELSSWVHELASGSATAKQKILSLGRFAEPHLTRALALTTVPAERGAAEALLVEIRQKQRWAPTAAE